MVVQWMKCSEIGDFEARLSILELGATLMNGSLSEKLRSFSQFYRLFLPGVFNRKTDCRAAVDMELKVTYDFFYSLNKKLLHNSIFLF